MDISAPVSGLGLSRTKLHLPASVLIVTWVYAKVSYAGLKWVLSIHRGQGVDRIHWWVRHGTIR